MKADFPSGPQMGDDDWEQIRRQSGLGSEYGDRADWTARDVTPTLHDEPYTTQPIAGGGKVTNIPPHILDAFDKLPHAKDQHGPSNPILNTLIKIMKAPDGMAAQARASKHAEGKAKTASTAQTGATAGRELAGRGDLTAASGDDGTGAAHALADSAAGLLGAKAAQEFYGKLGVKSPDEFAATGGMGTTYNATDAAGAANTVGSGSDTGMPQTPQPNTASKIVSNIRTATAQPKATTPPTPSPVDYARNKLPKTA